MDSRLVAEVLGDIRDKAASRAIEESCALEGSEEFQVVVDVTRVTEQQGPGEHLYGSQSVVVDRERGERPFGDRRRPERNDSDTNIRQFRKRRKTPHLNRHGLPPAEWPSQGLFGQDEGEVLVLLIKHRLSIETSGYGLGMVPPRVVARLALAYSGVWSRPVIIAGRK